jgi:hypothetical protein
MNLNSFSKTKLATALIASAYFIYYSFTPGDWHFLDNLNLIIHEAGHVIFSFFGEFLHILGGSLWQVLLPCLFVIYFYKQQQYFSASLVLFWVGQNLINVSVYASDALAMQLPLLGGDGVMHDWHALLNMTGLLRYTYTIGTSIYALGVFIIICAIFFSITSSFQQSASRSDII